jgi:hypothetical protein
MRRKCLRKKELFHSFGKSQTRQSFLAFQAQSPDRCAPHSEARPRVHRNLADVLGRFAPLVAQPLAPFGFVPSSLASSLFLIRSTLSIRSFILVFIQEKQVLVLFLEF